MIRMPQGRLRLFLLLRNSHLLATRIVKFPQFTSAIASAAHRVAPSAMKPLTGNRAAQPTVIASPETIRCKKQVAADSHASNYSSWPPSGELHVVAYRTAAPLQFITSVHNPPQFATVFSPSFPHFQATERPIPGRIRPGNLSKQGNSCEFFAATAFPWPVAVPVISLEISSTPCPVASGIPIAAHPSDIGLASGDRRSRNLGVVQSHTSHRSTWRLPVLSS